MSVKGEDQSDVYKFLTTNKDEKIGGDVSWNFEKYLIGRDGHVLARFGPKTLPTDGAVAVAIEKALAADR